MKITGVIRRTYKLMRIIIPKEVRRALDIKERDPVEIFVEMTRLFCRSLKTKLLVLLQGRLQTKINDSGTLC